jgi:hypothetical protein
VGPQRTASREDGIDRQNGAQGLDHPSVRRLAPEWLGRVRSRGSHRPGRTSGRVPPRGTW